jgi:hypothetical protein
VLTVGNRSYPDHNTAIITSFHYSYSDGSGVQIEVTDEEGGAFSRFFEKILVDVAEAVTKYEIQCKWGWVGGDCQGGGRNLNATNCWHNFLLQTVDIKYEQTMKFVLHCTDLFNATIDASANQKTYGSDTGPMPLKQAITELLQKNNPGPVEYQQLRKLPNGGVANWEWKDDPKDKWVADQRNALGVIKKWMRGYTTDNDKGVKLAWDDCQTKPTVIAWEDGAPRCTEIKKCWNHIATYIVNGGDCSPVVSFNPQIKWPVGMVQKTGGGGDHRVTAENGKQEDEDECNFEDEGPGGHNSGMTTTNPSAPEHLIRNYGKLAWKKFRLHDKRHGRANAPLIHGGISADLVIQGDPSLDEPLKLYDATVSLIVVNPFHLSGTLCPEWTHLAGSACNETLSNQTWRIRGITHDIRQGTYTTTLRLWLEPPGGTAARSLPMGQNPDGKIIPK